MKEKQQICSSNSVEVVCKRKTVNYGEEIREVEIGELVNFKNHPFQVNVNTELFSLMESNLKDGVLVPLIVRPNRAGKGYEVISGHRRKTACEWGKLTKVPVIIRELEDEEAIIMMVDSNLQRENIKPSEKAFAYKMKLDAMKSQGKRNKSTSCQVVTKLETDSLDIQNDITRKGYRSDEELARQVGESQRQIQRYIRLTNLIPQILDMVDNGKIAFTIGVELSYIQEREQYELYAIMDQEQCTPSLSQANRLKRIDQQGELDMDAIYEILEELKPNQEEKLKISSHRINAYFPTNYSEKQKEDLIEELLKKWCEQRTKKLETKSQSRI